MEEHSTTRCYITTIGVTKWNLPKPRPITADRLNWSQSRWDVSCRREFGKEGEKSTHFLRIHQYTSSQKMNEPEVTNTKSEGSSVNIIISEQKRNTFSSETIDTFFKWWVESQVTVIQWANQREPHLGKWQHRKSNQVIDQSWVWGQFV